MMCANLGDHDPLSKAVLGWITPSFDYASPRTIRLSSYTKTGCALIVSPDEEQSYFKDSYIVMLYEPTGVNEKFSDKDMGFFSKPGIVIYRVRAKLANRILSPLYCYKYNNSNAFGTMENALIRLIQNNGRDTLGNDMWARANDEDLFLEGDSYTFTWPDDFGAPSMSVTVDGIEQDGDGSWYADITLK